MKVAPTYTFNTERRRYLNLEARIAAERYRVESTMTHRLYGGSWLKVQAINYPHEEMEHPFFLAPIGTEIDSRGWENAPCIGFLFEDGMVVSHFPRVYTEAHIRLIIAALKDAEEHPHG